MRNCSCSNAVRHRQSRRTAYRPQTKLRGHGTLTYNELPHAALACRLMYVAINNSSSYTVDSYSGACLTQLTIAAEN